MATAGTLRSFAEATMSNDIELDFDDTDIEQILMGVEDVEERTLEGVSVSTLSQAFRDVYSFLVLHGPSGGVFAVSAVAFPAHQVTGLLPPGARVRLRIRLPAVG